MLKKIVKQQKEQLLTLMIKNESGTMWLTKKISETPDEIKELDVDKEESEDKKEQHKIYINYLKKLEELNQAKEDNLFDWDYLEEASKKVKKYV